jgi:hypothetical protein
MQDPNTSKRIMATISHRKGSNHVLEGSQDFIWFHACVDTLSVEGLFSEPLCPLKNVVCTFLYNA